MIVIARQVAVANGLKRFFTGQPCPHGHFSERYVSSKNCIECVNERQRKNTASGKDKERCRIYREKNPEKIKEINIRFRTQSPEKAKACLKRYRDANKEKIKNRKTELARIYRAERGDEIRRQARVLRSLNPEKYRTKARNRRRALESRGSHTTEDVFRILRMQKSKCAYCRIDVSKKYHVDHIIPVKRGGSNFASNLQILCMPCNMRKNAKDPIVWAQEIGMLL